MAGLPKEESQQRFTYSDYVTWPDGERLELVGGELFAMSPSPQRAHQSILIALSASLYAHFRDRPCEPFPAPFDVRLSEQDVVQPDLLVVCDPDQIKETHVEGPPTLMVEILSPSSIPHDRVRKFTLYERFGVQEYWLVTPNPALIEVFSLENGRFHLAAGFRKTDTLTSPAFPDLAIDLSQVFTFPVSPEEEIHEVREGPPAYAVRSPSEPVE